MLRRASTLNRGAITAQYLPCPAWYRVNAAHGEISFANLTLIMRRYRLIDRPLSTNYELRYHARSHGPRSRWIPNEHVLKRKINLKRAHLEFLILSSTEITLERHSRLRIRVNFQFNFRIGERLKWRGGLENDEYTR